jgi:L-fuculose-phosphate aldolase
MTDQEADLRQSLVQTCRDMQAKGLSKGTSGNVSVRSGEGFLISPTGIPYEDLQPDQVVRMLWDGSFDGPVLPSSEWRFHADILRSRNDLNAVVHTHSLNATAVAILGRAIPPIHYLIAAAGGEDIRCAPYATFGTQALADLAVTALVGRRACLLAHHGMIAAHSSLSGALKLAETVEELAALYLKCLAVGEPPVLSGDQIAEVLARFRTYGQQRPEPKEA